VKRIKEEIDFLKASDYASVLSFKESGGFRAIHCRT
jgi:hypothetical protein